MAEKNVVDLLLELDVPAPQTKALKHKRLSKLAGADVILTIKELGFNRVAEVKKLHGQSGEMDVHIVLSGLSEPNLKDERLMKKYDAATPAELAKKLFQPGEISDIAHEIEKLSGYRIDTLEDIEKK